MKWNAVLAGVLFAGGLALSPKQTDIRGIWRIKQENPCNTVVVRIKMDEGIWRGKADHPSLNQYDKSLRSIRLIKDTIIMEMDDLMTIKARLINDSTMTGTLKKGNLQQEIELNRQ